MNRSLLILPVLGVLGFSGAGALASGSEIEAEAPLLPPVPAPDPDAFGKVELEKGEGDDDGGEEGEEEDEQEFEVWGKNLATQGSLTPFEVWLEDGVGSGNFFSLGQMELESEESEDERWELELEGEGAAPPQLGVADLADLAGRIVQVRAAGGVEVYLTGIVPSLGPGGGGAKQKAQVCLQRPVPAPDPDAFGKVVLEKDGSEQEFEVFAGNLPAGPGEGFEVFVEEAVGTGGFLPVGAMSLESESNGKWELDLEGEGGAPPQLGVDDLSDLAGRRVEVRSLSGDVYLWGILPALGSSSGAGNVHRKADLVHPVVSPPSPKAKGTVAVRFKASQGMSFLEVKAQKGLLPSPTYVLWIEDEPGSGDFTAVGELRMNSSGTKGRLRCDTKKGDPLPLAAGTVLDLSGHAVEIRDGASVVHLEGIVP